MMFFFCPICPWCAQNHHANGGKLLSVDGSLKDTLGALNPLTYRGYVYDTETEFYYLQSRYYNPTASRFLNADAFASTGQGLLGNNMFAYCGNNPIIRADDIGQYYTPGQIHDFVIKEICDGNPNMEKSREENKIIYSKPVLFSTYGYCDIHHDKTGEVWELKRFSNSPSCQFAYAFI